MAPLYTTWEDVLRMPDDGNRYEFTDRVPDHPIL